MRYSRGCSHWTEPALVRIRGLNAGFSRGTHGVPKWYREGGCAEPALVHTFRPTTAAPTLPPTAVTSSTPTTPAPTQQCAVPSERPRPLLARRQGIACCTKARDSPARCLGALELVGLQANRVFYSRTDGVAQLGCSVVRNSRAPFCANGPTVPCCTETSARKLPVDGIA